MSFQNHFDQKRLRRIDRRARQEVARRTIPHCGVVITKADVKRHLYLQQHGLPHSDRVAAFASFVKVA